MANKHIISWERERKREWETSVGAVWRTIQSVMLRGVGGWYGYRIYYIVPSSTVCVLSTVEMFEEETRPPPACQEAGYNQGIKKREEKNKEEKRRSTEWERYKRRDKRAIMPLFPPPNIPVLTPVPSTSNLPLRPSSSPEGRECCSFSTTAFPSSFPRNKTTWEIMRLRTICNNCVIYFPPVLAWLGSSTIVIHIVIFLRSYTFFTKHFVKTFLRRLLTITFRHWNLNIMILTLTLTFH